MDMLQLFVSPAGRALITTENRSKRLTAPSPLSRERLKQKSSKKEYDSCNKNVTISPKRQRKSSTELYKDAIEILGLTCKLNDNCRCIDCQVINIILINSSRPELNLAMINRFSLYFLQLYSLGMISANCQIFFSTP